MSRTEAAGVGPLIAADQFWGLTIIILIILLAGLLGGYAAFLAEDRKALPADVEAPPRRLRFLILGVVASACVPLFLSLVRSDIIRLIFTGTGSERLESGLIFSGLCLVAAFSARSFIDSISQRILQQVQEAGQEAERAAGDAKAAKQAVKEVAKEVAEVAEAVDDFDAPPPPESDADDTEQIGPITISPEERKVLEAMQKRTYRTRTGISEDSGTPKSRISEMLEGLADRKLALPTRSPRTGGERWFITKRGIAALGQ